VDFDIYPHRFWLAVYYSIHFQTWSVINPDWKGTFYICVSLWF